MVCPACGNDLAAHDADECELAAVNRELDLVAQVELLDELDYRVDLSDELVERIEAELGSEP